MPPIKVLHLIPTLSSGGAERQIVNLVNSTSKELVTHVVCVIDEGSFFAPDVRNAGGKVIEFGISAKHPFFTAAFKFRRVIAEEKPDIIQSWLYDANVSSRIARLLYGRTPLITSLCLPDYEPEAIRIAGWNPYKVLGLRLIDKFTATLTSPFFVSCSEFVKSSYKRNFGTNDERMQVIYNSIDPEGLHSYGSPEALRQEFELPENAFVYLNVGRLDPQKNHKTLFEAFCQLQPEVPNAYLLLAGVGGMEPELKELATSLEIHNRIRFLGRRSDVGALLDFADVFVFPSFFEGFGIALVEAMFKSLPCIASRIEVFEEILQDRETGLMIDPNSPNELKYAMLELYKNTDLRKTLGENGFRCAASKFHAEVIATQWEELYQHILDRSRNL